jgi:hypothetical protein
MPFKQVDTKFTFQLSNASGQSWLCKSEMLRSGAKAAAIGNRNNVANLVQLHSHNNSVGSWTILPSSVITVSIVSCSKIRA